MKYARLFLLFKIGCIKIISRGIWRLFSHLFPVSYIKRGQRRIGPRIGPNKTFLFRTVSVMHDLEELRKRCVFVTVMSQAKIQCSIGLPRFRRKVAYKL